MQPLQTGRTGHRHLPVGLPMHGGGVGGGGGGTAGAPGGVAASAGTAISADIRSEHGGTGPRRRPLQAQAYHAYPPQMIGYAHAPYPYYPIPQPNGYPSAVPAPQYIYAPPYSRQPPQTQFVHMAGVSVPGNYNRHSPALSTPYQPPHVAQSLHSHTPSSTHSSHTPQPPLSPSVVHSTQNLPISPPAEKLEPACQVPFRAPLPWLSHPEEPFPQRTPRSRRRKRRLDAEGSPVSLRSESQSELPVLTAHEPLPFAPTSKGSSVETVDETSTPMTSQSQLSSVSQSETQIPSSQDRQPDRLVSPVAPIESQAPITPVPPVTAYPAVSKLPARPPISSVLPIIPALPRAAPKDARPATADHPVCNGSAKVAIHIETLIAQDAGSTFVHPPVSGHLTKSDGGDIVDLAPEETHQRWPVEEKPAELRSTEQKPSEEKPLSTVKAAPKSWASLLTNPTPPKMHNGLNHTNGVANNESVTPTTHSDDLQRKTAKGRTVSKSCNDTLVDVLQSYRVGVGEKLSFIEPRGLINTGNMCYMNSVLQVLIFCVPFYDFLDQVSKKAVHSFKSETLLINAMVMFLREFKIIDATSSVDQLRRRIKADELEQYGEPFTPDFVYEIIRKLPRFASMRRGHQQDAEEFLGFLLQSLDDECTQVMGLESTPAEIAPDGFRKLDNIPDFSDWLEVGPRQRSAITRLSGSNSSSPVSKIFGGLLRSELRVPGLKDSVTTEPYQPLQLDIGSPRVHNILDALRGLTTIETLHGDFGSPRGKDVTATKQVFIESLPAVLILHLKRFQFDAEGNGTVKVWKKIGYPLDLEIPLQMFSRQKRNSINADGSGPPRYKLTAVMYHHGKNASGGHYTVDVRRQDGREWIRLDDTVIRRISSEDVAEAGAEEDQSKAPRGEATIGPAPFLNRFGAINDEEPGDNEGWKQVNSTVNGNKRWSAVVNGSASNPSASKIMKSPKDGIKDNKVAYLLFYQRI